MVSKNTIKIKIAAICFLFLSIVLLQLLITPTVSRLRDIHLDEVRGYYTALHLSHDAEGKVVALEEQFNGETFNGYHGTFSFTMNNFDIDGITQRDISYKIYTKEILNDGDNYYVTGVWGRKIPIEPDTINYTINILDEGKTEATAVNNVLESYVTNNPDGPAVGASNSHIIEITRNPSAGYWDESKETEEITIVIELNEPYHEIVVANISVSPRLIVYSISKVEKFNTEVTRLHIQTASSFKEISSGDDSYLPDAFRVILKWDNLLFDNTFNDILKHIKSDETPDPSKINTPCLLTPMIITTEKTLQMYIPAGSEFYIDFFNASPGDVLIYAYAELKNSDSGEYTVYDEYNYDNNVITDVPVLVGNNSVTNLNMYKISE